MSRQKNKILRLIDMLWKIIRYSNEYSIAQVDVFSGYAFFWAYLSTKALKIVRKPIIITLHGGKLPEFAYQYSGLFKSLLFSANWVTTPSNYLKQKFLKIRPDIRYLPNGVDISNYPYLLRKNPTPRLIWLRAFHKMYCPYIAVEVLNRIIQDFPNAELIMIGPNKNDGAYEETIKTADKLRLMRNLKIIGGIPKEKVGEYLSEGDIFLNTTLYESFGVSVIEAAACGLCIVTTNVGELPYLWEDGVDTLLVPPNDPDAITAAVKRILIEPGLAEKLSKNARKKAELFDWSMVLPQWEELINSLL